MVRYFPTRGRLIVRLLPPETRSEFGLHLPTPVSNNRRGVVVEIGALEITHDGTPLLLPFQGGDTIVLSQFTQGEIVDVAQRLVAVRHSEVLARVSDADDTPAN